MTNKKMTTKEFKEILASADIDFDVFGWEGLLCMISNNEYHNYEDMKSKGLMAGANARKRSFKTIHDALEKRGYFDR